MNKYLIFSLLLIIFFMNFVSSETMANIKSKVFLNTDMKSIEKEILEFFSDNTKINLDIAEEILQDEEIDEINREKIELYKKMIKDNKVIWEKKYYELDNLLTELNKMLKSLDINLTITKKDLEIIRSRKELIQAMPLLNKNNNLTYKNVRNLIKNIEPNNLINVIKSQNKTPKYFKPYNIYIIDNFVYYLTPYGVLKYSNPKSKNTKNTLMNGVLEATVLNDVNKFNSNDGMIFMFRGNIIQKVDDRLIDIKTDKNYDLNKELMKNNYWFRLMKAKQDLELIEENIAVISEEELMAEEMEEKTEESEEKTEESEEKAEESEEKTEENTEESEENFNKYDQKMPEINIKKMVGLFNRGPNTYVFYPNKVIKNDEFSSKINKMLYDNNLTVKGIIPRYVSRPKDNTYELIILCKDDIAFTVIGDTVSKVFDFKKTYGFGYTKNTPDYFNCADKKILFEQLVKSNVMTQDKSDKLLKKLKCT